MENIEVNDEVIFAGNDAADPVVYTVLNFVDNSLVEIIANTEIVNGEYDPDRTIYAIPENLEVLGHSEPETVYYPYGTVFNGAFDFAGW